jgi:thioredoxin reductase
MNNPDKYDAIIIGGSYAGLSAGLSMGRALQNVLIIDSGAPCNRQTPHSHNFLTRDGEIPATISKIGLSEVLKYETVSFLSAVAETATGSDGNFSLTASNGSVFNASKLLFATGITDIMPAIAGFSDCWGISVIHCPYCHGYEYKNQKTGVLMNGDAGAEHAAFIRNWSDDLTVFTNGKSTISAEKLALLSRLKINLVEEEIEGILHESGQLHHLLLTDGRKIPLDALYARLPFQQHTNIPVSLGCKLTEQGYLDVDGFTKTSMPGIFAAGDNTTPMRSVSGAVAAGTFAGAMMSRELIMDKINR